jgi:hypothetical protein
MGKFENVQSPERGWAAKPAGHYLLGSIPPHKIMFTESENQPGFKFVYVNQDGSVRELSPGEQAYLSEQFSGGDGGRPYIKSNYESSDGWGSQSGFIERHRVPSRITILPVHPNYDALEKELGHDILGPNRAAGDIIKTNADGSVTCTFNPNISRKEGFKLSRNYMLSEQRRREALAKI